MAPPAPRIRAQPLRHSPCRASPLLLVLQSQKKTGDEKEKSLEGTKGQCMAGILKSGSLPSRLLREGALSPSPTHAAPVVQVVLVLLHFPTARVAAVYQAVGSEVHAVNLRHQGLHLLVQDVKPDMDKEDDWGGSMGTLPTAQSLECGTLAFSFHLQNTFDGVRGQKGKRYADIPYFLVHGFSFMV